MDNNSLWHRGISCTRLWIHKKYLLYFRIHSVLVLVFVRGFDDKKKNMNFTTTMFCVLFCFLGGASENSVSRKIQALAGDTVVLPCHISVSDDIPTVEWSKEGLHPDVVFLYRDGCETHEMKNLDFQFRSNLFMNELKYGNISLRVTNVQLSDEGTYICKTLQKPHRQVVAVELVVGMSEQMYS